MRITKDRYTSRDYPEVKIEGNRIDSLPDSKMCIVIPTLMREEKQITFKQIPDELLPVTYLVTKNSRVEELSKHNPKAQIIVISDETQGIAETRQKCIENLPKGKIWMLDDSIKLQKRNEDDRVTGWATPEEIVELYDVISYLLDYYPQVGISDRPGNNRCMEWKKDITRAYTTYGLRTDFMKEKGFSFDGLWKNHGAMFYEDYYLTLSLFAKGYPNTVIYDFVSSVNGRNNKGGNSLYRTNDKLKLSIESLIKEFPKTVKMKTVESESWGGELGGFRYEPRISWKKTFELSQGKKERKLF